MTAPLLLLIGGPLVALAGVVLFAPTAATAATLAVTITLPPAVVTYLAVVLMSRKRPEAGPSMILAGTLVRMLSAVACVAVLQDRAADFGTTAAALTQWTTGFYLLTLVLETGLLCRHLSRPTEGVGNEPPTG
jgi:hypothetical protein